MSHRRHGSGVSRPSASSAPGSSSSSYADVRLAKGRQGLGEPSGDNGEMTVRRRRLASEDIDNTWDDAPSIPPESSHPLAGPSGSSGASSSQSYAPSRRGSDSTAEASRPTLTRLTSETEQQVEAARSSTDGGSLRGSFDLLRTALKPAGDVEVLVHQVQPGESLQGIALQYGIDLPVLRKVNKLWASDPVSLRRELYVPLDACRWTKTAQTVVRGPEEGQITLVTRRPPQQGGKGKGKQREDVFDGLREHLVPAAAPTGLDPAEEPSIEGLSPSTEIPPALRSLLADGQHSARIHTILRLPASDLAFFPKTTAKDKPGRQSLDTYFSSTTRPAIPRSPSSTDTLSAAAAAASHARNKSFVTVGSFRKPFSPPTMTPVGRAAIPNVRAGAGRSMRSLSGPSTSNGAVNLGQLGNGITSKLSSLFIGPESPADSLRSSTDSTPRTAGAHEAPYELTVRSPSGSHRGAQGIDWFGGGPGGPNGQAVNKPTTPLLGQVKTTQPLRSPAMSVPGKMVDRNHIDLGN